jgi:hypothetical protein
MKIYLILSGLALWTAFVAVTSSRATHEPPAAAPHVESAKRQASSAKRVERRPQAMPAADPARLVAAKETIEAAVVRYEPSAVKDIRPWLLDADPQIRQAARDGLVQLGESDAVPFLRDAASRLQDPAEIASLHEAADLLSLPAWSDSDEARQVVAEITADADR